MFLNIIKFTPLMSKPRAATAVATKIGILPVLKSRKASSLLTSSSHVFHESWIYFIFHYFRGLCYIAFLIAIENFYLEEKQTKKVSWIFFADSGQPFTENWVNKKIFFMNKTFFFFMIESSNFLKLFEKKFRETSQNFNSIRQPIKNWK